MGEVIISGIAYHNLHASNSCPTNFTASFWCDVSIFFHVPLVPVATFAHASAAGSVVRVVEIPPRKLIVTHRTCESRLLLLQRVLIARFATLTIADSVGVHSLPWRNLLITRRTCESRPLCLQLSVVATFTHAAAAVSLCAVTLATWSNFIASCFIAILSQFYRSFIAILSRAVFYAHARRTRAHAAPRWPARDRR